MVMDVVGLGVLEVDVVILLDSLFFNMAKGEGSGWETGGWVWLDPGELESDSFVMEDIETMIIME